MNSKTIYLTITILATIFLGALSGVNGATLNISYTANSTGYSYNDDLKRATTWLAYEDADFGVNPGLSPVQPKLEEFDEILFEISAPAGQSFDVNISPSTSVSLISSLTWDNNTSGFEHEGALSLEFTDLTGTAPVVSLDSTAVGSNGRLIDYTFSTMNLVGPISFSSVRMRLAYDPAQVDRQNLLEVLQPSGGVAFVAQNVTSDPGNFITMIPEPSVATYLLSFLALAAFVRRRKFLS